MISYLLMILAVTIKGTSQQETKCFANGSMVVKNPDETAFKFFDISFSTDNADCTGEFSDNFMHLHLKNCKLDESIDVLFRSDSSGVLKRGNFAGPYSFKCKNIPMEGVDSTISMGVLIEENASLQTQIMEVNGVLIITKLSGGVSKQTVNVAVEDSKVQWQFDAPKGFAAIPDTCASVSQLLISRGCSVNRKTSSDFVQINDGNQTRYSITLFTNQFAGSRSVTVVCSMRLCSPGSSENCKPKCDGRRRKRLASKRSITGVFYETAILNVEFKARSSKQSLESNSSFSRYDWTCVLLSLVFMILKT